MAIENRNLEPGTRLVARYRKEEWQAEVLDTDPATYALCGEQRLTNQAASYKSLSAAGSAVMGGINCNGWRFWSLEGEASTKAPRERKAKAAPKEKKPKAATAARTPRERKPKPTIDKSKVLHIIEALTGTWWCNACMDAFEAAVGAIPEICPSGHRADDPEFAIPVFAREFASGAVETEG